MDFFQKHPDEQLSAARIAEELGMEKISLSAIYRNLAALEEDGKLQRISKRDSHEIYYRYKACEECRDSLHLSCQKCGKTFHLNEKGADKIISALSDIEGFSLDKTETVLYGVCGKCREDDN